MQNISFPHAKSNNGVAPADGFKLEDSPIYISETALLHPDLRSDAMKQSINYAFEPGPTGPGI